MKNVHQKRHRLYGAALFLAFHYYLFIYINSSFISAYVNQQGLAFLYALSAAISLLGLYLTPRALRKIGVTATILFLIAVECTSLVALAVFDSPSIIMPFFVLIEALPLLILYCMDIFLERCSANISTGAIRGFYLTLMNAVLVISPLLAASIITTYSFSYVYAASALFLIPVFIIILMTFASVGDAHYHDIRFMRSAIELHKEPDVARIISINFLLQFFYAVMVIYMPLLLSRGFGMSWAEIGVIFAIMLLPFPLFEWPVGYLADKCWGEKEIIVCGFLIMAASTFMIPFISSASLIIWAMVLFTTRVGASLVEVGSDTYFFKHVNGRSSDLISFYRGMVPLSYLLAPLFVAVIMIMAPLSGTFAVTAICMLGGVYAGSHIKDTL